MAITLGDVILFLGADDSRLGPALKGAENKAQGWVNSLGGKLATGLGAIVTAAIGGAAALGLAAFKAGGDLDAAYDTLLIKTGASGDALEQLKDDFKAVFTSVPTEAGPAVDVLSVLYDRLKLTGAGAQGLGKDLLEASRLMKEDASQNAELFTRVLGDWAISNDNAEGSLNKIFTASQKANVPMSQLMQTVVQFGAPLRQMGFSFDESIAMLAKWQAEGVNTELVLGSLRIAAGKFADEGKPLKESLMATFDAIKNAKSESAALTLAMDVFGARAGPDMAAAIREGRFELDDMVAALQDSENAISETSKKTMDWGEKLQMLKNKATLALEPIGLKLMDVASVLLDKAGPALDWFSGILEDYLVPALDKGVEALNLLLAGDIQGALETLFGSEAANKIMTFAQTLGDFINNVLLPFATEHAEEIKGALLAIGAALAGAAIVSIVTSIGAAIAAIGAPVLALIAVAALLGAAWTGNWGGIQEKTAAAIAFVKDLLAGGMQFINDLVNGKLGLLSLIFTVAWSNIQLIFAAFQAAFQGDWHRFGELLRTAWDNSWTLIKAIFSTAWENIKTGASNGIQAVKDFFTKTDWGQVGKNILEGIAKGLSAAGGLLVTAAQNAATAAMQAIAGFFGGGSSTPTPSTSSPTVKHKAGGGRLQAGVPYLTSEFGPELFVPPTAGTLIPNAALGGGGSMQFTYVDQRMISLSDEFEAERILTPIFERINRKVSK